MKPTFYEVTETSIEKALIVRLIGHKETPFSVQASIEEMVRLAETAGVEVLDVITQSKEVPDPKWLVGKGKVREIRGKVEALGANTVLFDREVTGVQVRNLEGALDVKIMDYTQLILDIFAQRAKTREGILQVELAQLNYLLPRLSGQGKNLSRLGGGIGTRGPGETKLETNRRHIRQRIRELEKQLADIVRHRSLYRQRRKKSGLYQVALVGYTNAGKSTLLKRLTDADVLVEDRLFATLDPTSRLLQLPNGQKVLLTDTVGFVRNLPHTLVAAFRATLEEVLEADLILHVVDSHHPAREMQMEVVDQVLHELGAGQKERIIVYNKADRCPQDELHRLALEPDAVCISAFLDDDLDLLRRKIQEKLAGEIMSFVIPAQEGRLVDVMYRIGEVLRLDVMNDRLKFTVRVHRPNYAKYEKWLQGYAFVPNRTVTGTNMQGE